MRIRERLRYLREGNGFYLMNSQDYEMDKPFVILSAHMHGDNKVVLIKHRNKIVSIARKTREFKFNMDLPGLGELTLEQIAGFPLQSIMLEIETEGFSLQTQTYQEVNHG